MIGVGRDNGHRREPDLRTAFRGRSLSYRLLAGLIVLVTRALCRITCTGAENLPRQGGFLVCANHISDADPGVLTEALLSRGVPLFYLAKRELFDVPVFGGLLRRSEQIPVYRESGVARIAYQAGVRAVQEGRIVAVYPEGTLTRDPKLWPMRPKTGAARIALSTGCPVIPVALWGTQRIIPPRGLGRRGLPRFDVRVRIGPPVDLSRYRGGPQTSELLAGAGADIMEAIAAQLEPLRPGERRPQELWDPRARR